MSEREPITAELRAALDVDREFMRADGTVVAQTFCVDRGDFERLCDAIDAVHAALERVAVLDNERGNMHIGSASVTITPTLDWAGVARELRAIADTLAGDAE